MPTASADDVIKPHCGPTGFLIHDEIREVLDNNIATYQSEELPIETEEQRSED